MHYTENRRFDGFLLLGTACLVMLCLVALSLGRYSMNPADAILALSEWIRGTIPTDAAMHDVLFIIRFPRVLAAVMIGAALSLTGAVFQGIFRNPLVSPDLLGVSSGAGVGAAIAILLGGGLLMVQLLAFLVGISAVGISVTITRFLKNESSLSLVLAGIVTGGFMSSLLGALKYIANPETQLQEIVFWQMGSIAAVNPGQIASVAPLIFICGSLLLALSWRINILSFGQEEAQALGMNVKLYYSIAIVASTLLTASAVSISGTIGWIGLVIPHLGRLIIGADNVRLMPTTMLLGGIFMLVMDTISRAATSVEIPLSILTGLIGAPFFAWLLWKQQEGVK